MMKNYFSYTVFIAIFCSFSAFADELVCGGVTLLAAEPKTGTDANICRNNPDAQVVQHETCGIDAYSCRHINFGYDPSGPRAVENNGTHLGLNNGVLEYKVESANPDSKKCYTKGEELIKARETQSYQGDAPGRLIIQRGTHRKSDHVRGVKLRFRHVCYFTVLRHFYAENKGYNECGGMIKSCPARCNDTAFGFNGIDAVYNPYQMDEPLDLDATDAEFFSVMDGASFACVDCSHLESAEKKAECFVRNAELFENYLLDDQLAQNFVDKMEAFMRENPLNFPTRNALNQIIENLEQQ